MKIFLIFYNLIFLPLIFLLAMIASIFNNKIRKGFLGRMQSISKIKKFNTNKFSEIYWFHSSSHGEYQQVETLINEIKKRDKKIGIIASFFSPSGFENVKDPNIDLKIYLPFDFIYSCYKSLKIIRPKKIFFTSNDFWPSFLFVSKKLRINTILTSARYNKSYNIFFKMFDKIFCISDKDLHLISKHNNHKNIFLAGNPRFDRILANYHSSSYETDNINTKKSKNFIFASMWKEDNKIIFEDFLNSNVVNNFNKILIVPHEISKNYLDYYCSILDKKGFSYNVIDEYKKFLDFPEKFLIVNKVGFLSKLYFHTTHAYVGGGFSKNGIHNISEPAVASNVVMFGPIFSDSNKQDANNLIEKNGGFLVNDSENFIKVILDLENKKISNSISKSAKNYVYDNSGATQVIMEHIYE
tara:strand:- start:6539 stop:7774 length:1236 start_codon:yes stop_codon:yes gene_type:complete